MRDFQYGAKLRNSPLVRAASRGDAGGVAACLRQPTNADYWGREYLGNAALKRACQAGHEAIIRLLLGSDRVQKDEKTLTPALSAACHKGNLSLVQLLVAEYHAPVNGKFLYELEGTRNFANSPLECSCHDGHTLVAQFLLEKGATVSAGALRRACSSSKLPLVRILLEQDGAYIYAFGVLKFLTAKGVRPKLTPAITAALQEATRTWENLRTAVANGDGQEVEHLLAQGANVNSQNEQGLNAVHVATEKGDAQIMGVLLQHTPDLKLRDNTGRTAVHIAAEKGDAQILGALLQHSPDLKLRDTVGQTPLHVASTLSCLNALLDSLETADKLKNSHDKSGYSPFHTACMKNQADFVQKWLEIGIEVDQPTKDAAPPSPLDGGQTGLHVACESGSTEVVKALLKHGAEVNSAQLNKRARVHLFTPLHKAADAGHMPVAKILLAHPDIEVNAKNSVGLTALHLASAAGHLQIAKLLSEHDEIIDIERATKMADENGHKEIAEWLLSFQNEKQKALFENSQKNRRAFENRKELFDAVNKANADILKTLLDRGADPNVKDDEGWPLVHRALDSGSPDILRILLEHGADANATDTAGLTALHWACEEGNVAAVSVLLQHGGDADAKCHKGETPLDVAKKRGHLDAVRLLVIRFTGEVLGAPSTGDYVRSKDEGEKKAEGEPNENDEDEVMDGITIDPNADILFGSIFDDSPECVSCENKEVSKEGGLSNEPEVEPQLNEKADQKPGNTNDTKKESVGDIGATIPAPREATQQKSNPMASPTTSSTGPPAQPSSPHVTEKVADQGVTASGAPSSCCVIL